MKRLLVVLLFAVRASAQSLVTSAESPLAAPINTNVVANSPVTASDGNNTLVVWFESRQFGQLQYYATVATRIDRTGRVLDVPNIELPIYGVTSAFWNGREYIVLSGNTFIRVSSGGELLDPVERSYLSPWVYPRAMVWNGERLLLLHNEDVPWSTNATYATILSGSLQSVRYDFILGQQVQFFTAASNGNGYMIAGFGVVSLLDRDGNVIWSKIPYTDPLAGAPRIVSDGRNYLVMARTPYDTGKPGRYILRLITPEGEVKKSIDDFTLPGSGNVLALLFDGRQYQVIYAATPSGARAVSISSDGVIGDPIGRVVADDGSKVTGFVRGGNAETPLVFWTPGSGAWTAKIDRDDANAPIHYTTGIVPRVAPSVPQAHGVGLATWIEPQSSDTYLVRASRIDQKGHAIDAQPITVGTTLCGQVPPVAATDGSNFMVAWRESTSIRAVRVDRSGHLLDAAPISPSIGISPGGCSGGAIGVAWNGSSYLVAWPGRWETGGPAVCAGRIAPNDGALLDVPAKILSRNEEANDVHAASDGRDFLVTWTNKRLTEARASRIAGDGTVLDVDGFGLVVEKVSALFWSGREYVALLASGNGAHVVRITGGGQRLDLVPGGGPGPELAFPLGSSVDCDARGCFTYGTRDNVLYETRLDDTASGLAAESIPLLRVDPSWYQLRVFGTDILKNVVYDRVYAGSSQLFARGTLVPRGRAAGK